MLTAVKESVTLELGNADLGPLEIVPLQDPDSSHPLTFPAGPHSKPWPMGYPTPWPLRAG